MNAPSKIFVSLEHVITCLGCFTVSVMMVTNWTEQEGTVQVWPLEGLIVFSYLKWILCAKCKKPSNFCLVIYVLDDAFFSKRTLHSDTFVFYYEIDPFLYSQLKYLMKLIKQLLCSYVYVHIFWCIYVYI
jgi:hypothetical protein